MRRFLIVASAADTNENDVISSINVTFDSFFERGCHVLGVIVNRADPERLAELKPALLADLADESQLIAVIPADEMLRSPSMAEIATHLNTQVFVWRKSA